MGSYTSPSGPLTNAAATINVPAGSLQAGTYKPTVNYSGDSNYNSASGTANNSVTVTGGATATLTVSVSGNGTVKSTDGHINCPGTCSYAYAVGTSVTLSINPASGYNFQVTGCPNGIVNGNCLLTMTSSSSVSAIFTMQPTGTMVLVPSSLNFYSQIIGAPLNNSQTVTVESIGGTALDQVFVVLSGPNAGDYADTSNCPTYGLNSGSYCTVTVTFTPTGIEIGRAHV